MTERDDLLSELVGGGMVGRDYWDWAARFAALPVSDRTHVMREARAARDRGEISPSALWDANFRFRAHPAWRQVAVESLREAGLVDPAESEGDDERSRRLRIDRDWCNARVRRGFVLDGSPGAWRPVAGVSAEEVAGEPRATPRHHPVSLGAWSQTRLMPDDLLREPNTSRRRLLTSAGQRTRRW